MISRQQIKKNLPKRTSSSNKATAGRALIIGGGKGLYGAALLAALAATRSGAGYTHLMTDLSQFPWLKFPDFIVHPLKKRVLENRQDHAVGIGPGLGTTKNKDQLLTYLMNNNFEKVVVDADALTLISAYHDGPLPASWILTPHEGELSRLLKISTAVLLNDRKRSVMAAHQKFGCTILLKGSTTLIKSAESKKIVEVKIKSHALAKAGTGDVLLGIICALRAQGLSPLMSAAVGAYVHGEAAFLWEKSGHDQLSLRPMDLIEMLPFTLKSLR